MKSIKSAKSLELLLAVGLTAMGANYPETVQAETTANNKLVEITSKTYLLAQGGEIGEEMSATEQVNSDFQDKMTGIKLLNALRRGVYVIYFRHAQTEKDYADQVTANPNDCSTQRTLSEVG